MLKNVLIVVDDIEKSIEFYRDLWSASDPSERRECDIIGGACFAGYRFMGKDVG